MSNWPSSKASRVYRALLSIGWELKAEKPGSHKKLHRAGYPPYTWAWHDSDELGPRALRRIAKKTGLTPNDL
ncbi:MAG: type II toxin-antitoxin system HicA family toxin [Terriglobales bacterium]